MQTRDQTTIELLQDSYFNMTYNMNVFWKEKIESVVTKGAQIYYLGEKIETEFQENQQEQLQKAQDRIQKMFQTTTWFTYRKVFPKLINTVTHEDFISDTGWGCMIRAGQMIFAEGLQKHLELEKLQELSKYKIIIAAFADDDQGVSQDPEIRSPYSIQKIAEQAKKMYDRSQQPGQWFNPQRICLVMQQIHNDCIEKVKGTDNLKIYNTNSDEPIVMEKLRDQICGETIECICNSEQEQMRLRQSTISDFQVIKDNQQNKNEAEPEKEENIDAIKENQPMQVNQQDIESKQQEQELQQQEQQQQEVKQEEDNNERIDKFMSEFSLLENASSFNKQINLQNGSQNQGNSIEETNSWVKPERQSETCKNNSYCNVGKNEQKKQQQYVLINQQKYENDEQKTSRNEGPNEEENEENQRENQFYCKQCHGSEQKFSLLVFIGCRIGLNQPEKKYLAIIDELMAFKHSIGVIGGRPQKALYFPGRIDQKYIYLDPHKVQQMTNLLNINDAEQLKTHFCQDFQTISQDKIDSCLCLGFYLKDLEALQDFYEKMNQINKKFKQDNFFWIEKKRLKSEELDEYLEDQHSFDQKQDNYAAHSELNNQYQYEHSQQNCGIIECSDSDQD
uniref:Cysteine protease n=1 Tax=Philasterides dicentrarchi TaxID=282688 RepID=A0A481SC29_9CILI|nr:peptidase family C54 protein [Philasterides dicentrarchi]